MSAGLNPAQLAPPARGSHAAERFGTGLAPYVLILLCVITWALDHAYVGLFHDARLYLVQALSILHPDSLGRDVFLRFGSQDRYSLFSPLFAAVIGWLGPEHAAALITFVSQVALIGGGWRLARAVLPAPLALCGVATLIAIPGYYGSDRVFAVLEPFLTPRMAAEALVLAGLAAALNARAATALALVALAALFHPIMAAAGFAALASLQLAALHPRRTIAAIAAGAALLIALAAAAHSFPHGVFARFDPAWLQLIIERSPYLFVRQWTADDWAQAAIPLTTLIVGWRLLPGVSARSLCVAAFATTLAGFLLTWVACDLAHLVLFTQLQPWRWQWLGTAAAALLLPAILHAAWQQDAAFRPTAMALIAAWLFGATEFGPPCAVLTLASLTFMRGRTPGEARWLLYGACGLLAIALAWRTASNLEFTDIHYMEDRIPHAVQIAVSLSRDGALPLALVALVWWLAAAANARGTAARAALWTLAALATAACVALAPQTLRDWTRREFPPEFIAKLAPLRARIPPGADVLWGPSPVGTWLLLERPNYLSVVQTAGMLFSRDAAFEFARRAGAVAAAIPPSRFLGWKSESMIGLSRGQLQLVCASGAVPYLVTSDDLGVQPAAHLPRPIWPVGTGLRLYRCPAPPVGN